MDSELRSYLSPQLIELLVFLISAGDTTVFDELLNRDGKLKPGYRSTWAALLASALVSRGVTDDSTVQLLKDTALSPPEPALRRRYSEQVLGTRLLAGRYLEVADLLKSEMSQVMSAELVDQARADLENPFVNSSAGSLADWEARLFERYTSIGLSGVSIGPGDGAPFTRLTSDRDSNTDSSGPVSAALLVTKAGLASFCNALRSLQNQTWSALEILVLDTSRSDEIGRAAHEACLQDSRVRYERLESQGTHDAISRAIEVASGEFLTWQVDDCWSHPERIERQVREFERSADVSVVTAGMWFVNDMLAYAEEPESQFSLPTWMARTQTVRETGPVIQLGTTPLGELSNRVIAATQSDTAHLPEPLVINSVSMRVDSTTAITGRDEVAADAKDIARIEVEALMRDLHDRIRGSDDPLAESSNTAELLNDALRSLSSSAHAPGELDVLMVGDWHSFGGPQLSMLAEIGAFLVEGKSVGVMHLEPPRFFGTNKTALCAPICDLILKGEVVLITPVDEVHAGVTVVRYPPIFAFGSLVTRITQDQLVLLANQAPSERDGADVRYRVEDVCKNVQVSFGRVARWAPQGPEVRATLVGRVPPDELLDRDLPGVIDTAQWHVPRSRFRGSRPVIGRHSRDDAMKWPADPRQLLMIYPDVDDIDVRVMGGGASASQVLGGRLPANWLVFSRDELPVRAFLSSLDFFVYYQHPDAVDAFGRAVLEALAAGCVVILPIHMRPVFGDAAVYCEPEDVQDTVRALYDSPAQYFEQSARAVAAVGELHSFRSHADRIAALSAEPATNQTLVNVPVDSMDRAFPRGFVYGGLGTEVPRNYQECDSIPGLYIDPLCIVDEARSTDGQVVVIIGTCISSDVTPSTTTASHLLRQLRRGESQFFGALSNCIGRHAVVYGNERNLRVVTDATGMRTVFYGIDGGVFASHALLVEHALGGSITRSSMPFNYGFPGNKTPYSRTKIVTPNNVLDVAQGALRRFWPVTRPAPRQLDEVAELVLASASEALRRVSCGREVKLALTAGLDSRTLLAVAIHSGIEFETYTYDNGTKTRIDSIVARDLARQFGLRHTRLAMVAPQKDLSNRLGQAHYSLHHPRSVSPLRSWIGNALAVAVTANLLEIGRSFYKPYRENVDPPITAEAMRALHGRSMHSQREAYAAEDVQGVARQAFSEWMEDADVEATLDRLNPFDQFYWEHRMAAWHGPAMVERDFYAEPFIPFNSRDIFESMLGLDQVQRDSGAVFWRIIDIVDGQLLKIPVNPRSWPR